MAVQQAAERARLAPRRAPAIPPSNVLARLARALRRASTATRRSVRDAAILLGGRWPIAPPRTVRQVRQVAASSPPAVADPHGQTPAPTPTPTRSHEGDTRPSVRRVRRGLAAESATLLPVGAPAPVAPAVGGRLVPLDAHGLPTIPGEGALLSVADLAHARSMQTAPRADEDGRRAAIEYHALISRVRAATTPDVAGFALVRAHGMVVATAYAPNSLPWHEAETRLKTAALERGGNAVIGVVATHSVVPSSDGTTKTYTVMMSGTAVTIADLNAAADAAPRLLH